MSAMSVSRTPSCSPRRLQAVDAAEMIWADIEPLDAVVTIQDAMAEDILLFPDLGTNRSFQMPSRVEGDVTDGCEVVVQLEFTNPHPVAPIEPRPSLRGTTTT